MMKVIHLQGEVGTDGVVRATAPADLAPGPVAVLVVLPEPSLAERPARSLLTAEQRLAAARAGSGALRGSDLSVADFLAERRADDARRDRTLRP